MATPQKYEQSYDFSDYQASNPSSPLPGVQVDIQFAEIAQSIDEIVDALGDVRRSDGALQNDIVTADALDTDIMVDIDAAVAAAEAARDAALASEVAAELAETNAEAGAVLAAAERALAQANAVLAQDAQHLAEIAKVGAQGAESGAERARDDALTAQTAAAASASDLAAAVADAESARDDAEDARDAVLMLETDLEAALDAISGVNYLLDWGSITDSAGTTNDWGSIA